MQSGAVRARAHIELIGAEVHRRVEESERRVGDGALVCGGCGEVRGAVEDGVVRRDAAQGDRDVGPRDEWFALAHVQDASDRLGLGEGEEHKVTTSILEAIRSGCEDLMRGAIECTQRRSKAIRSESEGLMKVHSALIVAHQRQSVAISSISPSEH
jgi:hypothetical protein